MERYHQGAEEITLRIVLLKPSLVLEAWIRSFTQKGKPLVVSEAKLNHQRRQILRREMRNKL